MKKPLFILLIAAFLGSCAGEFDDVTYTITNDSSKTVSFLFNNISRTLNNKSINKSITCTINSEKGKFVPKNIKFSGHIRSIDLKTLNKGISGIFYTFSDNNPLTLNVRNTSTAPVTIKADDFIGASGDTGGAFNAAQYTLTIPPNNGAVKAYIYTSTPNFTIITEESDTFQIPVIEWELKDDTIYAVIHKRF